MTIEEIRLLASIILLIGGALMIWARRYRNPSPDIGSGIVAWIIILLLSMWWKY